MEMATKGPVMDWSPDNGLPNEIQIMETEVYFTF